MSIESSSAPNGSKAAINCHVHANKTSKTNGSGGDAGAGFASVLDLLSISEDGDVGSSLMSSSTQDQTSMVVDESQLLSITSASSALQPSLLNANNTSALVQPDTLSLMNVNGMPFNALTQTATPNSVAVPTLNTILTLPNSNNSTGADLLLPQTDIMQSVAVPVMGQPYSNELPVQPYDLNAAAPSVSLSLPQALPSGTPKKTQFSGDSKILTTQANQLTLEPLNPLQQNMVNGQDAAKADVFSASPFHTLLAQKNSYLSATSSNITQDLQPTMGSTVLETTMVLPSDTAISLLNGSDLIRPQARLSNKSGFGQAGSNGFEGVFGQTMTAANRSDAVFEIPPASALVAETAVAETVTYWVSHGVQSAELTLDGFGENPVEVSIWLNGDQAQIDFRTDQLGVRQVLENATVQLKDMLSSQGLQLSGVSVSDSGSGSQNGGNRHQRPGTQQMKLVPTDAIDVAVVRVGNPSVGRSLDLFV